MENEREKLVPPSKAQKINESDPIKIAGARSLLIENETPQDKKLSNKVWLSRYDFSYFKESHDITINKKCFQHCQ